MKGIKGFQKGHKINLGKKYSKERGEKVAQALRGRKMSMEQRKKISELQKGRIISEEQRKKISLSLKGRKKSREEVERATVKRRGKPNLKMRGENNPNWKGGITPVYHKIRTSLEYKLWRKAVFERDKYTCVLCNKKGGDLEADHIKQFAYFPELRFELSNGRTLCKPCHKLTETHSRKLTCSHTPNTSER